MKFGAAPTPPADEVVERNFEVTVERRDDEMQIAFGWAYPTQTKTGEQIVDRHKDAFPTSVVEKAAYQYMLDSRKGGVMHLKDGSGKKIGVGRVVECMMFTDEKIEKLGLPSDSIMRGLWVGIRFDDPFVWGMVKNGDLPMFSIGGRGRPQKTQA